MDARQTPALIRHDKSVPAAFVLFIGPNGKSEKYESKFFSEDVLSKLLPQLSGPR
jgi:hypothetical protein